MRMSGRRLELNDETRVIAKNDDAAASPGEKHDDDDAVLPCRTGHTDELSIEDTVLLFQLHRVLNAPDMSPLLRKLRDEVPRGHSDVSVHAVCHLFAMDLTFGMFGTPIPREDDRLTLVALTSFDVYDKEVLASSLDVMTILTPLFRTLYIVQLCTAKIHAYDEFKNADPLEFLPYKPASTANHRARYASFLDVVLSMWTSVCHAYMTQRRIEGGGGGARLEARAYVHELHCFNINGDRAKHLWLDVDVAALTAVGLKGFVQTAEDVMTRGSQSWISIRSTTYDISYKLMVILECADDDDEETQDLPTHLGCVFSVDTVHGIYTRCGKPVTHAAHVKDGERAELLGQEYRPIVVVVFQITAQAPGFALRAIYGDDSQFLLITLNGGQYSAFYRNLGNQKIIAHPLYMHPLPPSRCRFEVPCSRCTRPYEHEFDYDYMTLVNFDEQPKYCSQRCMDGNLFGATAKRKPGTPPTIKLNDAKHTN